MCACARGRLSTSLPACRFVCPDRRAAAVRCLKLTVIISPTHAAADAGTAGRVFNLRVPSEGASVADAVLATLDGAACKVDAGAGQRAT